MVDAAENMEQVPTDPQPEEAVVDSPAKEYYLDPEGGYPDPEVGRQAEMAAMTKQAPVSVNNLPTKAYLE